MLLTDDIRYRRPVIGGVPRGIRERAVRQAYGALAREMNPSLWPIPQKWSPNPPSGGRAVEVVGPTTGLTSGHRFGESLTTLGNPLSEAMTEDEMCAHISKKYARRAGQADRLAKIGHIATGDQVHRA